jgi:hypothetical protein
LISQNTDLCCWREISKWVLSILVAFNAGKYSIDGKLGTKGPNALNDIVIRAKVGKCSRCLVFEILVDILEERRHHYLHIQEGQVLVQHAGVCKETTIRVVISNVDQHR